MYLQIKEIFKNPQEFMGKDVKLGGWVRTVRDSKTFGFIELNDGTFFKSIQVVFDDNLNNFEEITKMGVGSSITVHGTVVESLGAKQPFEIKASSILVEGESPEDYPLQKKRHSLEFLRTIAHLRPRTNTFSAVFRMRSVLSFAIHKFFNERGFVYTQTPIITGNDAEGAGEMFQVTTMDLKDVKKEKDGKINYKEDFFGKIAHLTVTGQLHGEAFALAFRDIYTFGPTFRAENSNTVRHAAEFWMMEPEIAFADLDDNIQLIEDMLKYLTKYCFEHAKEELEFFDSFVEKGLIAKLSTLMNSEFGRITYTEAIEILQKSGVEFEFPVEWGCDIKTEHEKYLAGEVFKKPVFVTDYPKDIKSFYMRLNDDGKTVAAVDLLVPTVGEIVGGSQREERFDVLVQRMEECGLNRADYEWYLDLRKYGGVKHAGFGLGVERFLMYITGVANIRDVMLFPRTVNNLDY
ncbi:MAG: asparagine--tRNA ligase [Defluviitaleaceae bacterium]|nr:asparagine--tRNA ligase [Defluviitaleaceae bacterium]